jgi:hypothetical protein
VASAVVALLVAFHCIQEISFDFTQTGGKAQLIAVYTRALNDCMKQESVLFTIIAAGLQESYTKNSSRRLIPYRSYDLP